jgi:uncharacterized membrane protein
MSIAAVHKPSSIAPIWRWVIRALAIVALGVSTYLAWHTLSGGSIAGCSGDGSGCDHVLASHWSRWLGLPVAVWAVACYGVLFAASWFVAARDELVRTIATRLVLLLAVLAGGAAFWFICLQFFAIGDICPYCMLTHVIGLTLAGIALTVVLTGQHRVHASRHQMSSLRATMAPGGLTPRSTAPISWSSRHAAGLTIAGSFALLFLLIGGQVLFPGKSYVVERVALSDTMHFDLSAENGQSHESAATKPEAHVAQRIPSEMPEDEGGIETAGATLDEPTGNDIATIAEAPAPAIRPEGKREVSFLGGKLSFDIYEQALIGSPEAPYVIVEMMDYTCPHCRKLYRRMEEALPRFGDQIAVVIMPVPLDAQCNKYVPRTGPDHRNACKYAQLTQAVFAIKPESFPTLHHYLLSDLKAPTFDRALAHAYDMVLSERLREEMHDEETVARIKLYIEFYVQLKKVKKDLGLPAQIIGDEIISGPIGTTTELAKLWEEKLGVKPIE